MNPNGTPNKPVNSYHSYEEGDRPPGEGGLLLTYLKLLEVGSLFTEVGLVF